MKSFKTIRCYTNKKPAANRSIIIITVFMENTDRNEKMHPPVAATRNTFLLPQVSAKKPHKCEENTIPRKAMDFVNDKLAHLNSYSNCANCKIPKYDIPLRTPCSLVDKPRSHFACGKMKLTFVFSTVDPSKMIPVMMVKRT